MTLSPRPVALVTLLLASLGAVERVEAQSMGPDFAKDYEVVDLGPVPGLPTPAGGLVIRADEPNTLYIGGSANQGVGAVYRVGLARDTLGRITSFGCAAISSFASAPNIDGGLFFGPGNVLFYTGFPTNVIGQIAPGATSPTKVIALGPLGITSSTGSATVVPSGFPGAGRLKVLSYSASLWYDASLVPDGAGTFDIVGVSPAISISGGPEGVVYIPAGNPQFDAASILVAEYQAGRVGAYEADSNGDPVPGTRRDFVTGLGGAEGAAIDPVTGDFLFSTFGSGNRVVVVRGFTISPTCVGDLNGSGVVDGADLSILLSSWGDCGSCPADLNGDCVVDGADVSVLLASWGPCSA